jgi:hypothetical protein
MRNITPHSFEVLLCVNTIVEHTASVSSGLLHSQRATNSHFHSLIMLMLLELTVTGGFARISPSTRAPFASVLDVLGRTVRSSSWISDHFRTPCIILRHASLRYHYAHVSVGSEFRQRKYFSPIKTEITSRASSLHQVSSVVDIAHQLIPWIAFNTLTDWLVSSVVCYACNKNVFKRCFVDNAICFNSFGCILVSSLIVRWWFFKEAETCRNRLYSKIPSNVVVIDPPYFSVYCVCVCITTECST